MCKQIIILMIMGIDFTLLEIYKYESSEGSLTSMMLGWTSRHWHDLLIFNTERKIDVNGYLFLCVCLWKKNKNKKIHIFPRFVFWENQEAMTSRCNVFTKHPDFKYERHRALGIMIGCRGGAAKVQAESTHKPALQTSTQKMQGCCQKK